MPGLHTTVGLIEHGDSGLLLRCRLLFSLVIIIIIARIEVEHSTPCLIPTHLDYLISTDILATNQWLRCGNFVLGCFLIVIFFRLGSHAIVSLVVTLQLT